MKGVIEENFEVEVTQPNMLLFVWRQCMSEYFSIASRGTHILKDS